MNISIYNDSVKFNIYQIAKPRQVLLGSKTTVKNNANKAPFLVSVKVVLIAVIIVKVKTMLIKSAAVLAWKGVKGKGEEITKGVFGRDKS